MAERHIRLVEDGASYTPPNIQPSVPVVTCWDTNINEETPSGHGTTHCTNGIIIQRADEMDTVCTDTTSDALGVLLTSPKF